MSQSSSKGNITRIFEHGIFVKFKPEWSPEPQEGQLYWENVPGCKSPSDLPAICKVGDPIMVELSDSSCRNEIILKCIEFPVRQTSR